MLTRLKGNVCKIRLLGAPSSNIEKSSPKERLCWLEAGEKDEPTSTGREGEGAWEGALSTLTSGCCLA